MIDLEERVSRVEGNVLDMMIVLQKIQADFRKAIATMEKTAAAAEEFRDATRELLNRRKSDSTH